MIRLATAALIGGLIGATAVWYFQTHSFYIVPTGMTYADLAATALSAVSVLVTILGVFIAILAVWGYSQFKDIAGTAAKGHISAELKDGNLKKHIEEIVRKYMEIQFRSGDLRKLLEERVDHIIVSGAEERAQVEDEEGGT